jgi:SAM-dependent methyltransferase
MNDGFAKRLRDSVAKFYEEHGAVFAQTRKGAWSELLLIAKRVKPNDTVVDIGAGNGRFFQFLLTPVNYVGIEPSESLRANALTGANLKPGFFPKIDLEDEIADMTVSFAVFHHLVTEKDREEAVEEMIRITKPEGLIAATAWYIDQSEHEPVQDGDERDVWIPWRAEMADEKRFVHAFTKREWEELFTHPDLEIERVGFFGGKDWTDDEQSARNFLVIAKKKTA